MKKLIAFSVLILIHLHVLAQEAIKIADGVIDYKVDRIGNVYYYDAKNVLTKYETKIQRYTRFADLKSGKISSIDVSNPLRVLVFYSDQGILKFLDVNLTEINSLQIRNTYPDGWISLTASSNNNGIWMYDNLNRRLMKLNEQLSLDFQSGDLYLVLSKKINPHSLLEYGDELYLADAKHGIFVFDLFGGYKRTIPIYAENILQIESNKIMFQNKKQWLVYQSLKLDTIAYDLKSHTRPIIFSKDVIFYLENSSLYIQNTY